MEQKDIINKREMGTVEKLDHLINVVKNIPEDQFNMDIWYKEGICGTVGCALGWAAKDPVFNEMGLKLKRNKGLIFTKYYAPTYSNGPTTLSNGPAAALFFKITMTEAYYMFDPQYYSSPFHVTKSEVIEHIKKVRDRYV